MQWSVRELARDEYPLWDTLVQQSPQGSIFAQRWWLDIVTGGGVQLLGCFQRDRLFAGLPIWPQTVHGVRSLQGPPLTPYWSPLLLPLEGTPINRRNHERHLLRAFAEALSNWPDVTLHLHPTLPNGLALSWFGYAQTSRYAYRITALTSAELAEKTCHGGIRTELRAAAQADMSIAETIDLQQVMAFDTRVEQSSVRKLWPALAHEAQARDCLYTAAAVDAEGTPHAALAMLFDTHGAYVVLGGQRTGVRSTPGWTFLLWHALQAARTRATACEVHLPLTEHSEPFWWQFGGDVLPYAKFTRTDAWRLKSARWLEACLQRKTA